MKNQGLGEKGLMEVGGAKELEGGTARHRKTQGFFVGICCSLVVSYSQLHLKSSQ